MAGSGKATTSHHKIWHYARATVVALLFATPLLASSPARAEEPATDASYHVGEAQRSIVPPVERNWRGAKTQRLLTTIWYPVDASVPEVPNNLGAPDDPLFRGHPVARAGEPSAAQARYPLILLSHGTGGSASDEDWLAADLAAHGYIVAGVNHPGNNALEPLTREGFLLWWERATDVSEALDALLADPVFGPRIDASRIGAMGFSLGGYTVLELAGARTRLAAFEAFCRSREADAICTPPEANRRADSTSLMAPPTPAMAESMAHSGDSYRDPRIKAVFAIAPALGEAFDAASFASVDIPVAFAAGTADVTAPPATNVERIAGFLPQSSLLMVPGASHYTFVDVCLPAAAARRPTVCKDGPDVDREAVHDATAARVLTFFDAALAPQPAGQVAR
ncbi:peptidase [Paraburkholderia sp. J12]|uniref:alpha/beta hydrolase family protein n=1 Tax=Paraburkholderia sp. J12 TaxID=2805432 RepID=UPI002ABDA7F4|nr:peptidase [Paraburkholderia sp. J12]